MAKNRENIRYNAHAEAHIPGLVNGDVSLKDISSSGCCIESAVPLDLMLNTRYKIQVIPEPAAKIRKFELLVESCWME
ncbi:MAG: PilZ domain-containing protein, partial [Treponema sp.]|nr:PilZ domain-containing protein [Treponema sp.]